MNPKIKVIKIAHHRNGVTGEPFHVVLFRHKFDINDPVKVAVVFQTTHHIAILDTALLDKQVIEFGENSWRGDQYEAALHKAITEWDRHNES